MACQTGQAGPPPEDLEAYLPLTKEEIAQPVLCLLVRDALGVHLADLPEAVKAHAARRPGS